MAKSVIHGAFKGGAYKKCVFLLRVYSQKKTFLPTLLGYLKTNFVKNISRLFHEAGFLISKISNKII